MKASKAKPAVRRSLPKGVVAATTLEDLKRTLRNLDLSVSEAKIEDISLKIREFKRHVNSDDSVGGFVERTARAMENVFVGPHALVLDEAAVFGFVRLEDDSTVSGRSCVGGYARIREWAYVGENAEVQGKVDMSGTSRIFQDARALEDAVIFGDALIFGTAVVMGGSLVAGNTQLCSGVISPSAWIMQFKRKLQEKQGDDAGYC